MMRRNRTTAVICLALIMMFTFASVVSAAVPQGLYIQGPQGASFVSLTYWAQNMNSIINLINGATGGLNGVNYVDGNQNYISLAQVAAGAPITNTQPIPSGQESQVLGSATFTDLSTNTSITPDVGEGDTASGTYTITQVTNFSADFKVSVANLENGNYFSVYRNGSVLGSEGQKIVSVTNGAVRSMPNMFSDTSILEVKFYKDAAGNQEIATATCANGNLNITLKQVQQPSGTYTVTQVTNFSADFKVSVANLENGNYFSVYRNGSVLGSEGQKIVPVTTGAVRSMPNMFSDKTILEVKFYSDANGAQPVASANCLESGALEFK